jgi:hypothetical protein
LWRELAGERFDLALQLQDASSDRAQSEQAAA